MYNQGYNAYIHTSHTGYHQPILMTHHYCTWTCYHVQQQQLKETMDTTRKTNSHNHSNFLDNLCQLLHNTSHCGVYSQNLRVNHCLHRLLNSPTRSWDSVVSLVADRNTMLATLHWGGPEFSCCVCWYFSIRQSLHCLAWREVTSGKAYFGEPPIHYTCISYIKSPLQHITVTPHHLLHAVSPVASAVAIHQCMCVYVKESVVCVSVAQYLQL